jgi:hypothetical protein
MGIPIGMKLAIDRKAAIYLVIPEQTFEKERKDKFWMDGWEICR